MCLTLGVRLLCSSFRAGLTLGVIYYTYIILYYILYTYIYYYIIYYTLLFLSLPNPFLSSHLIYSSFPILFLISSPLPNIHSIRVGTYIYLFILFSLSYLLLFLFPSPLLFFSSNPFPSSIPLLFLLFPSLPFTDNPSQSFSSLSHYLSSSFPILFSFSSLPSSSLLSIFKVYVSVLP